MKKTRAKAFRPVYPSPAALITCVDTSGRANIITLGEVFNISIRGPVIIGIAIRPATYSHGLISKTREYVVNLPTAEIVKKVDQCGTVSGRDGVDKFDRAGLSPIPASVVKPPLIDECPVNIECKVVGIQTVGDHDLFLGEILSTHLAEDAFDTAGILHMERINPLGYTPLDRTYRALGDALGSYGYSRKE